MAIVSTIIVICLITAGLIVYDIFMYLNGIPNSLDTISGRMRIWGMTTLFIPFAWSVLAGHFFGPTQFANLIVPYKNSIFLLVFISWGILIFGILMKHFGISVPPWTVLIPGIIAGSLLWHQ